MFKQSEWETTGGDFRFGKLIGFVIGGLVILTLVFGSFGTVSAGERGVKTRLGAVVGIIQPGLYVKVPIMEKVTKMDVRTQSLTATKDAPLSAASNDLQDTRLAVVVNYHIEPSTVSDIYTQYGDAETYYHNIVEPLIVATVKATASQYTAAEQIQKRLEMSAKALTALNTAFEGKNVAIEKADITDVSFSESFTQAIEAKVTAVQQAEAAKNKLEQVKYEAQQTIETAKATAEAQRIQSASLAAQGGADYVNLKAIEKWDGHLPQQMIPGSSVPFLNVNNR
jgi:regulator of protease activity HflC (stomatin/prohibitin superfamily)